MIKIESKENNLFKETKKLKDRRGRNKNKKYLIEGFRIVQEAFKARIKVDRIFVSCSSEDKIEEYLGEYINNTKIYILKDELLNELCQTENPQGIVAVLDICNSIVNKEGAFYLLCDKVQDPGNLGTIIRTAHAAGVDGIILTKGTVDVYNPKVIRATMGSIFYIPIILDDEEYSQTKELLSQGFSMLATSLQGEKNFFEEDLTGKIIISMGNEGNGVSEEIYNLSDKKVKIPMPGGAESLNVSVATAIILYEKVRQKTVEFIS